LEEHKIIPYIEPIYRFCCKRLSNRHDAEDLASEIVCHVLEGMGRYEIDSLDAWVWRIAHNRYARFVDGKNRQQLVFIEEDALLDAMDQSHWFMEEDYCQLDAQETIQEYQQVFEYLHTLSAAYRDIFVDYYLGEMTVRSLAKKYALPETTVKWRLNVSRQKIREWIGENHMEKIYKRINWETTTCNGSLDTDRYLHTQIARAICQAAYEKPLTVEEISMSTGIPAMYIEDELPRLEYGDAICRTGNKYATDFIIFRLQDRKKTEESSAALVTRIADRLEELFAGKKEAVEKMEFYGHDFGMDRLGYFLIPYLLRRKLSTVKEKLQLQNGPFPPRKDGGYGWFLVEETTDEQEMITEYVAGCNVAGDDSGSKNAIESHIYYYWIGKYFENDLYHNGGIRWMCAKGIPQNSRNGIVKKGELSADDAARIVQRNLLAKYGEDYRLNYACFTQEAFTAFAELFAFEDEEMEKLLAEWILTVQKSFRKFVPKRLESQINPWVSYYLQQLIGNVTDELIRRSVLRRPKQEKPLTDGIFYVEGKYIEP